MNRAEAAKALLYRRQVRSSLRAWCEHCGFKPARHHLLLIEELEKVTKGETKRLAIFLPPGSAKSTYASDLFVAWHLAQFKTPQAVVGASHAGDLAESFSRRVRNRIVEHFDVLGYRLSKESTAAGYWETDKGDAYYAVGVGGSITGRRADLAVIDDPVKGAEEANSETVREKKFNWYEFDLETRLKPDAALILIQTRWHEQDLAGMIFSNDKERAKWRIINIPMIAEENDMLGRAVGERLWPEYFTEEMVESAQRNPRKWTSLYQQRPTPEEGDFFKVEMLRGYDPRELPENLQVYAASDHAVGERDENSRTCLIPAGLDEKGVLWILPDIWWLRDSADKVVEAMLAMMKRRSPLIWWAEKGHISKSIGPFLRKRQMEEGVFCYVEEVVPSKDKQTRAQSIQGRASLGMVRFPTFASWWADALHELLTFPYGAHEDFVDTIAHLGMGIDRMASKSRPVAPKAEIKPMTFAWLKKSSARRQMERELSREDF